VKCVFVVEITFSIKFFSFLQFEIDSDVAEMR